MNSDVDRWECRYPGCHHDYEHHSFGDEPGCKLCYQEAPDRWMAKFLHTFKGSEWAGKAP